MARPDSHRVVRRRCEQVLSGSAAVVAVVGPDGSGKTTLLAEWAQRQSDAVWFDEGEPVDPVAGSLLLVDDADGLSTESWKQLDVALATIPRLRIRLAVRAPSVVPEAWSAELLSPTFSEEEVADCFAAFGSAADPRAGYALTGGHPASVVTLARSGATTPTQLAQALAGDTLATLPEELTDLAVPDHLTENVVTALGLDGSVLHRAERAGWGGWLRGAEPRLFAITPRRRASSRLRSPRSSAERKAMRSRAATALLSDGAHFPALVEAIHADRLDLADAALKQGGLPVLTDHGYELLLLLDRLPVLKMRRYPALAMALALVYNASERNRLKAIEMVGVALAGARLGGRSSPDRALMRVVESVGLRITGTGDGGLRAARAAAGMLAELPVDARTALGVLEPDLHAHIAISLLYAGATDEASEAFERAGSVHARGGVHLMALGGRAVVSALEGRLTEAGPRIADAQARSWPKELVDGYAGSMLRIAQAIEAMERSDFVTSRERIDAVWSHIDTIEHWPLLVHLRALIDIGQGDGDAGLERFREVRQRRSARRGASATTQRRLDVTECLILTATGDLVGAKSLRPSPRDQADVVLTAARVALLAGDHERTLHLLGRCEARTPIERLTRLTLETMLADRLGHDETAAESARRASAIVSSHGVRSPLMFVPDDARELFTDIGAPRPPSVLRRPASALPALTHREQVVLRELVTTSSVQQIAGRLHVSVNTIKSQRRSIYRKLGATSHQDAIATALAHGLLDT
ncbi:LuxR C-terminal-related transcriptional regulator [Aeromicrobium sp. CF4.19]|uniref:helix-turn-helix transcriptional regulator n=1 Tax=Aeromicrobium sp. CF4.19 TaxID=3373082 RepID=UPI003EE5AD5D